MLLENNLLIFNKKGNRKIDLAADKAPEKIEKFIRDRRDYGLFPSREGNF
jgi:hypothetical protein